MIPSVSDSTGTITNSSLTRLTIEPGYYLVSYSVSGIFSTPSYMQITPFYNGTAHLDTGIYFATNTNGSSACGSAHFILVVPSQTTFFLTYSSPQTATDGELTITFLKLNRAL